MKLTRLAAAPGTPTQGAAAWPRGQGTGATASQLIASVLRTRGADATGGSRMRHAAIVWMALGLATACLADVPASSYGGSFSCFRSNLTREKGSGESLLVVHVV